MNLEDIYFDYSRLGREGRRLYIFLMAVTRKLPSNIKYIVGIDEVGRGPLAGPVCVGAFAAPTRFDLSIFAEAKDSKKMTLDSREMCFKKIEGELAKRKKSQFAFTVSFVSSQMIDRIGLTKAISEALRNSLKKLQLEPKHCLVLLDGGLKAPKEFLFQKTIIKGDDKEKIISLASIVAKVSRDRKLIRMSRIYPGYNLEKHKGYGTLEHRRRILSLGPTPIHRRSFLKNFNLSKFNSNN